MTARRGTGPTLPPRTATAGIALVVAAFAGAVVLSRRPADGPTKIVTAPAGIDDADARRAELDRELRDLEGDLPRLPDEFVADATGVPTPLPPKGAHAVVAWVDAPRRRVGLDRRFWQGEEPFAVVTASATGAELRGRVVRRAGPAAVVEVGDAADLADVRLGDVARFSED